jgi:hypothetical protein
VCVCVWGCNGWMVALVRLQLLDIGSLRRLPRPPVLPWCFFRFLLSSFLYHTVCRTGWCLPCCTSEHGYLALLPIVKKIYICRHQHNTCRKPKLTDGVAHKRHFFFFLPFDCLPKRFECFTITTNSIAIHHIIFDSRCVGIVTG